MLVKGIYELWGEGSTCDELEEAINEFPDDRKLPFLSSESSFKIVVDSFGKVLSLDEQNERIERLAYIPFKVLFFLFVLFYFFVPLLYAKLTWSDLCYLLFASLFTDTWCPFC